MFSILHRIEIEASPEKLFAAINTESGLSAWWSKTKADGESFTFFFGPNGEHQVTMALIASIPNKEIRWKCTQGPWVNMGEFIFSVESHERGAVLDFAHHGWQETDNFYKHCNPKWAFFLAVSLKQYLETGTGQPHPKDPSI